MPRFDASNNPAQSAFLRSNARFLGYIGGIGCVGGETRINGKPISELAKSKESFFVETAFGRATSPGAFSKGFARQYLVVSELGDQVWVTEEHRFLGPNGWTPLRQILEHQGQKFVVAVDGRQHEHLDIEIARDFARSYYEGSHPGDELSNPWEVVCRDIWQQLRMTPSDDFAQCVLLSIVGSQDQALIHSLAEIGVGHSSGSTFVGYAHQEHQRLLQSVHNSCQTGTSPQCDCVEDDKLEHDCLDQCSCGSRLGEHVQRLIATPHTAVQSRFETSFPAKSWRSRVASLGIACEAYDSSLLPNKNSMSWAVCQVVDEREAEFFDLHVPVIEHYSAEGFWHHNSGKTAAGAVKTLLKIDEGKPGIMVAPDFPHFTKSTWPEFKKWCPWDRVTNGNLKHPYTKEKTLWFRTRHGEVPLYYGGIDDPDAWTGPTVNFFWFDEGRRKQERDAFDVLAGRIRTGHKPQGFVTTSPAGINHWLYHIFVDQQFHNLDLIQDELDRVGQPLCEYVRAETKQNRDNLDPLYYYSLLSLYTGKYAEQELEGRFVSFEGAVYEELTEASVTEDAEYRGGVPIEWGVDDGFTQGHPRVILMAQEIPPYINVFNIDHVTYELAEDTISRVKEDLPWPLASVGYIDSSAAELRSRLIDADIDVVRATHRVEEGIKHTRSFICDGEGFRRVRFHPRCDWGLAELRSYVYPEKKHTARQGSGQPRPKKENDNAADALRYLLWFKKAEELDELANMSDDLVTKRLNELREELKQHDKVPVPQQAPKVRMSRGGVYAVSY